MHLHFGRLAIVCSGVVLSSCSLGSAGLMQASRDEQRLPRTQTIASLKTPVLLAVDRYTSGLLAWPIAPGGGKHPMPIAHFPDLSQAVQMAANGYTVAAAIGKPDAILLYDVQSGHERTMHDPFGAPVALTIDRSSNLFAMNVSDTETNVTMYPRGSWPARQLLCKSLAWPQAVAADNEGDLFAVGYNNSSPAMIEFPNGRGGVQSGRCSQIDVKGLPYYDYIQNLQVDPKTDDLILFDDPGVCAGLQEGRMAIFPRPYHYMTRSVTLGGLCPSGMWFDGPSQSVFYIDTPLNGGQVVRQVSYPDGRHIGSYSGTFPQAVTSIPNSLPN